MTPEENKLVSELVDYLIDECEELLGTVDALMEVYKNGLIDKSKVTGSLAYKRAQYLLKQINAFLKLREEHTALLTERNS